MEIGLNALFLVFTVLGAGLYVRWRYPKWKREAFKEGEQWIGGTLGRFLQAASEGEEGGAGAPGGAGIGGSLNIGGFKLDAATLRSVAEILKLLKEFGGVGGLLGGLTGGTGGGSGSGGGKIGL